MERRRSIGRLRRTWPYASSESSGMMEARFAPRDILTILQETGTSFISENPVYSVVGALKVARENGWVVKKGRGWWQAASRVPVDPCAGADGGESVGRGEGGDGDGSHE